MPDHLADADTMVSAAREAWRKDKRRLLSELAACGHAWEVQSGIRFDLRMRICEGVPLCEVIAGDETIVRGALV